MDAEPRLHHDLEKYRPGRNHQDDEQDAQRDKPRGMDLPRLIPVLVLPFLFMLDLFLALFFVMLMVLFVMVQDFTSLKSD